MDMQADLVFRLTRGNLAGENVLRATYHMRVPAHNSLGQFVHHNFFR